VASYAIDKLEDAQVEALAQICARLLDGSRVVPAARNGAEHELGQPAG
jgi:hypothetical protein